MDSPASTPDEKSPSCRALKFSDHHPINRVDARRLIIYVPAPSCILYGVHGASEVVLFQRSSNNRGSHETAALTYLRALHTARGRLLAQAQRLQRPTSRASSMKNTTFGDNPSFKEHHARKKSHHPRRTPRKSVASGVFCFLILRLWNRHNANDSKEDLHRFHMHIMGFDPYRLGGKPQKLITR